MLKGFSEKERGQIWIGFVGLRIAPQADISEQSRESSRLCRASMTINTLYYPTDAQIYNS